MPEAQLVALCEILNIASNLSHANLPSLSLTQSKEKELLFYQTLKVLGPQILMSKLQKNFLQPNHLSYLQPKEALSE